MFPTRCAARLLQPALKTRRPAQTTKPRRKDNTPIRETLILRMPCCSRRFRDRKEADFPLYRAPVNTAIEARQKAGRSSGLREVTRFLSTTTSAS